MMKNLKLWILIPISVFTALLLVFVLLTLLVDPNDYRDEIEQAAQSNTNIDVQIKGDISWSLFPWIGFDINQLDIYLRNSSQTKPILQLATASASLKIAPLLSGDFEVGALVLKGLTLNLVRDENGHGNWNALFPEVPSSVKPQRSQSSDSNISLQNGAAKKPPNTSGFRFSMARIEIENAQLHFKDQQTSQQLNLELKYLRARDINSDNTFPISMAFKVVHRGPSLVLDAQLDSMMGISRGGYAFYFKELLIQGGISGALFNAQTVPLTLSADLAIDRKSDSFNIKALALKIAQLPIVLKLTGKNISTHPMYEGSVRIAQFNPQDFIAALGQPIAALAGPQALTNLAMKANFVGSVDQWVLNDFKLKLDTSTMVGQLKLAELNNPGFDNSALGGALSWELALDHLKLDDYMPSPSDPQTPPSAEVNIQPIERGISVELLQGLKWAGNLRVESFEYSNIELSNIVLNTTASNGLIRINPLKADLYSGQVIFKLAVDAQSTLPKLTVESVATGLDLPPLFDAVTELERLEGTARMNVALQTQGFTRQALLQNLDGTGQFEIIDGQILGVNFTRKVCEGIAKLADEKLPAHSWSENSEFEQIAGTFVVNQGKVTTDDMTVDLQSLSVNGAGILDIPSEQIDYRLALRVKGEQRLDECEVPQKWQSFRWPIRCRGNLNESPATICKLETAEISRQLGAKVENKLKKTLNKRLKKLFEGH
ncbi:MAG: AsmA family protein [Pseudomonadales bacterium]|nr:AsmA family protein [Pseudomonadales bacterium]